ncbi:sodium-dependent transporter [uncultured Methanobrevibacter sp.]|uniref:sodium-dependent transporter n=1 Tax=uncultured Methanobrevibacter sp. TaxID=253161 RepID=UPI0025FB8706|nr:sodium-dependent transporter [uncultured Methanobrevibacter sp.]
MSKEYNEWSSNLSFILAMIGSAVGLGNIWRYPYVLYSNGGGAFYIPYLTAILVLAIPFLILEYGVGYNFRSSFAKGITNINPEFQFFGWFLPVVIFIMTIYYSTIIGWDGIYVILSFFKGWGSNPNAFLTNNVLHASSNLGDVTTFVPLVGISMLVCWFIVWSISHKKVSSGLSNVSKVVIPLLFAIMIFIVGFSLTLPGANLGLNELFKPDWSLLSNFSIWMAAFGQIFFSLSLGMGAAFTFASYTKSDIDLISSSLYVIAANSIFENFAALGVFSVLGYMSLQSGVPVSEIVSQGTGLIFVVYPTVFNILGPLALIIAPLFFFTVYISGITSMLSSFEVFSSSVQNKFHLSRKKAVTILCIIGAIISMVFATAPGEFLVTVTDEFVNNISLVISVFIECLIFSWIFNMKKIISFFNDQSKFLKIGNWWVVTVRYIISVLLIVIWIGGIHEIITTETTEHLILLMLLSIFSLLMAFIFTKLPPRTENWLKVEERVK